MDLSEALQAVMSHVQRPSPFDGRIDVDHGIPRPRTNSDRPGESRRHASGVIAICLCGGRRPVDRVGACCWRSSSSVSKAQLGDAATTIGLTASPHRAITMFAVRPAARTCRASDRNFWAR